MRLSDYRIYYKLAQKIDADPAKYYFLTPQTAQANSLFVQLFNIKRRHKIESVKLLSNCNWRGVWKNPRDH